MSKLETRR